MGLLSTIGSASGRAFGLTRLAAAIKDAYFNQTTLLLNGDGTNGAQNNTFLDSSSNNFTITRNGNTTQGTFSPFSQTGWSTFFSGSPYLETPSNAAFSWGTGDFSMEFQVYVTAGGVLNRCLHFSDDLSNLAIDASNRIELWVGSSFNSGSYTVTPNTWAHVVATRVSGTCRLFLNGMLVASTSNSFNKGTGSLQIGGSSAYSNDLNGYLSGVRLIKGGVPSAYSTSSTTVGAQIFTPPTTAFTGSESLTAGSVSFLGLQQNRWVDLSSNAFAITVNGTPSVQAFSPFAPTGAYSAATNGGSGYFDGSGDSLSVTGASLNPSGTAITIDFWFYPTATGTNLTLFQYGSGAVGDVQCLYDGGNTIKFQTGGNAGSNNTNVRLNQWNFVTCTKDGSNNFIAYVNGTTGTTVALTPNSTTSLSINSNAAGYMSGFRVTTGAANTPSGIPTAPPTTTVAAGTCRLLLNFTNGGIIDATGKNVLETVGDAKISTTQSKWGGASMSFDGTGDWVLVNPTQNLEFRGGDFTIEFWWYPTSTARQAIYHGSFGADWSIGIDYSSFSTNQKIGIWASSTGASWNLINADPGGNGIGTTTITQNAWNHIAFVRSGSTWMLYVNGNRDLNITGIPDNVVNRATYQKAIGVWYNANTIPLLGYIDDFRISRYARYSGATITVPAASFPVQ